MNLLIKFPTRNRPERFFQTLELYYRLLANLNEAFFLVTCDVDDSTMNNPRVREKLERYPNMEVQFSPNKTKVEAINCGLNRLTVFDILLLASDDMKPEVFGYDTIIREGFHNHFPDLEGVLWFNDGCQANNLNTLCIMGRNYFLRFGYVYHPSYRSLWCDNEFTLVAAALQKQLYFERIIIRHHHPALGLSPHDELNRRDDQNDPQDRNNFLRRQGLGFPVDAIAESP